MSVSGFSVQHDVEVQQYNSTRAIVLAQQERRRQEFRRQLGIPEPVEDDRSLLRRVLKMESKQNKWLDTQLVKSMAAKEAEEDSDSDESVRKMKRAVQPKQ